MSPRLPSAWVLGALGLVSFALTILFVVHALAPAVAR